MDMFFFNDTLSELIMVSDYEKKRIIKLANKNLEGFSSIFHFTNLTIVNFQIGF